MRKAKMSLKLKKGLGMLQVRNKDFFASNAELNLWFGISRVVEWILR